MKRTVEDPRAWERCIIAKHRNGETGIVPLRFIGKYVKFVDLEDDFAGMGGGDGGNFSDPSAGFGAAIQPSDKFGNPGGGITMPSRMNDMPDDAPF